MKKIFSFIFATFLFSSFLIQPASAETWESYLYGDSGTHYRTLSASSYQGWGMTWATETKFKVNYRKTGSGAMYFYTYYNDEKSHYGANVINRGPTYLVDTYNGEQYSVNTYCTRLSDAYKATFNKTVGWKSTMPPYFSVALKNNICAGQNYITANHLFSFDI